jgi:hypothetical protein
MPHHSPMEDRRGREFPRHGLWQVEKELLQVKPSNPYRRFADTSDSPTL